MAINGIACVIYGVDDLATSTSFFEDLGLHPVVITSIFYGVGLSTFSFRIAGSMGQFISTAMVIPIITALSLV
jgi:catechol 2,3-dioxygenase-like lactoylglutathione lyase family enzyme